MVASAHNSRVAAVLAGDASYDGLDATDQAVVRDEWAARTEELLASLDR
jgi:hypothetical protein